MEDKRDAVTTAIVDKGIRACRNKRQALMVMTLHFCGRQAGEQWNLRTD